MKYYKIDLLEIFFDESFSQNEKVVAAYKTLLDNLLDPKLISDMGIFESYNFLRSTMSAKPALVEPLLRKRVLPHMYFLVCSN